MSDNVYDVKSVFVAMDGRKIPPPLFSKRPPPPLKDKGGGALPPPFRKKRVVAIEGKHSERVEIWKRVRSLEERSMKEMTEYCGRLRRED